MSGGYRVRLRAVISDYHHAAATDGPDFDTAASVLAELLRADHLASEIVPALDAAAADIDDVGVLVLLKRARNRVIGDRVTAAHDDTPTRDDLAAARAFNDQINVHLCDVDHRASA